MTTEHEGGTGRNDEHPGAAGDVSPARHPRWIMHVDMDAFFAAVELKEQPSLSGLPVVVGGSGPRGVVASASYEARAFGVGSAMPMSQARRLCPDLVILAPRFDLYQVHSERLHEVLQSFTPVVEGLGLDEAFLDMTNSSGLFGPPPLVGSRLRERVANALGLGCSVGAGPNKLVAKLASKAAKPRASRHGLRPGPGIVVIGHDEVLDFLWPMEVEALWGVGPASAARLHQLGVTTVGQLAALPREAVAGALGKSAGHVVHSLAWGRDARPVVPDRAVKSIGQEETYPVDRVGREDLERRLVIMADSVATRVRRNCFVARTVTVKLRYGDFTTLTRSHTFDRPQTSGPSLWTAAKALLAQLDLERGVRLLGLSASGLLPVESSPGEQLQLDLGSSSGRPEMASYSTMSVSDSSDREAVAGWARATEAVDAVRARFGQGAVGPAVNVALQGGQGQKGGLVPPRSNKLRQGND